MPSLPSPLAIAANPFALLVSPDTVTQAVARSERLSRLRRQVFKPLDKPLIPLRTTAKTAD